MEICSYLSNTRQQHVCHIALQTSHTSLFCETKPDSYPRFDEPYAGWYKAIVLWLFTICFAAGVRNLLAHMLFGGLLPGEEYIDHEAFQTVFVRLIPYWFNQWEQQWGVECTSLLFELPYFATELLVILPFVQVRSLNALHEIVSTPYQHTNCLDVFLSSVCRER